MVMGPTGLRMKNGCAGEDQQQFSLPDSQQDDLINILLFFKNNEIKLKICMDVLKDFQG
jgi:hypothetical protein